MEEKKWRYYIAQMLGGDIVVLSTHYISGALPEYSSTIIKFNLNYINKIYHSSRDGYLKENKQIKFYEITFSEFYYFESYYDRICDTVRGMIKLSSPTENGNKSIYIKKLSSCYIIARKIAYKKYDYIEFAFTRKEIITGLGDMMLSGFDENSVPIKIEVFDIIKYFVVSSLKDIYDYLSSIIIEKSVSLIESEVK